MRQRLIARILLPTFGLSAVVFASASSCDGCGTARQNLLLSSASASSGCGGSGGSTPKPSAPANVIEAKCTRDFEGPNNAAGQVTAYVNFVCSIDLETVTLTVSIWHSGAGGGSIGDKPEKSSTCFSIATGACTVSVPCTEGAYKASFALSALVDGTAVTDADQTDKVTYSAGDCTV